MPRVHKTLLVPGEHVTAANEQLQGRGNQTPADNGTLHQFVQQFNDNCTMTISVMAGVTPQLVAELTDQSGETLDSQQFTGDVAQDYLLDHGDFVYEVSLVRAANTALTPATIAAYNENPNICPACGSSELHASRPQIDGKNSTVRVECCACQSRWKDVYVFVTISTEPSDWDPPEQNVARQGA
jgi:formate dehydrogenase maturation protein FdhE